MKKQRPLTNFPNVERLLVQLEHQDNLREVGSLAWSREERRAYFEFGREFLNAPLPLSPFKLPTNTGVMPAPYQPFDGLHGLFNDSLPDGWGRLLLDRRITQQGYDFRVLTPLDRLAFVGQTGMGAIRYSPQKFFEQNKIIDIDLDLLAREADQVQRESNVADLDKLLQLQGGSAGARPKIMIGLDSKQDRLMPDVAKPMPENFDSWMVKFKSIHDPDEIGPEEYAYSLMARAAEVEMPETRLIKTKKGRYFAVRRFDRTSKGPVHIQTASALLELDHRTPQIDYDALLRLTRVLTRDERNVLQMFRRMVFNVLAHNRDDHAKNHAFQMSAEGGWRLAPAYDLTLSLGPAGEHSLAIGGEGRNPTREHVMKVAHDATISALEATQIFDQVKSVISRWPDFANEAGLSKNRTQEINELLNRGGAKNIQMAPPLEV